MITKIKLCQNDVNNNQGQKIYRRQNMKRYFYSGNPITKKLLNAQFNLVRMEDQIYRDALLAALKLQPSKIKQFHQLRQTFLDMTIQQQNQYANNFHLEMLFQHFDSLHRNSRGRSMIIKGKESLIKDIVDPDKFPVWDLKKKPDLYYSIWNTIMGKIRYQVGHELIVGNSLIEHPDGGRGVFVQLSQNKKQIQIGDFLGLVPGSVYDSYQSFKKSRIQNLKSYEKTPQHMHFPSGKVLQLGQFKYQDHLNDYQTNIEPFMINPYSLGQFINHPPYGQKPNVIFTEIQFKKNFFPSFMTKYLPYNDYLPLLKRKKDKKLTIFGIFARQPIKNKQELYVDYFQSHIYPIDSIPQWLTEPDYSTQKSSFQNQPDPYNLNFKKQEYENPYPYYWKIVQKQALKEKQNLYKQYLKTVTYRPKQVLYEQDGFKIRSMKTRVDQTQSKA